MQRTQIYLPKTQLDRLRIEAHKRRTTVSDVVRSFVAQGFSKALSKKGVRKPYKSFFDTLEEIKKLGHPGPSDLATNMDAYLYGDKK